MEIKRRKFLKNSGIAAIGIAGISSLSGNSFANLLYNPSSFELPKLPYSYNALEPFIDARTMEIHHTKHHQAYVNNLNKALEGSDTEGLKVEDLLKNVSQRTTTIRNNGGGHYNHTLFWEIMQPGGAKNPEGKLAKAISANFKSFDNFKNEFGNAAKSVFGSGWVWLILSEDKLKIITSPNQDNPLMDLSPVKGFPVIGLDVWEHAYYLNYQNRRPDYIEAWWNVVNWTEAEKRFKTAK